MNVRLRLLLTLAMALLISAHRLPAPIHEVQESPTPAQSPKPSEESKETRSRRSSSADAKGVKRLFAGTWRGTVKSIVDVKQQPQLEYTLIINPEGNSVRETSTRWGSKTYSAKRDGQTIKWFAGSEWTLTPNADGQTAVVRYPHVGAAQRYSTGYGVIMGQATFQKIVP